MEFWFRFWWIVDFIDLFEFEGRVSIIKRHLEKEGGKTLCSCRELLDCCLVMAKNRLSKLVKMVHISATWWLKACQSISMQPDPEILGLDYNSSLYFENTMSNNNGI